MILILSARDDLHAAAAAANLQRRGAEHRWVDPGDAPAPACFAFVSPIWTPRRAHAGTFDESWELSRFPRLPVDFDRRFHGSAPADLQGRSLLIRGARADGVPFLVQSELGDRFRGSELIAGTAAFSIVPIAGM